MAELLIYNRDHWSTGVSAIIKSNWDAKVIERMAAVYEKGDIVEIRPDYYWSRDHGWRKDCFALLKLPKISVKDIEHYMQPYLIGENLVKKRKYNINSINFSVLKEQSVSSVSIYDKEAMAVLIG